MAKRLAENRHVLIAGPSGSGKTTLLKYFRSRGKNVLDGDTAGIGIWVDGNRNPRKKPTKSEWEARKGWEWMWDVKALRRYLNKNKTKELYAFSDGANLNEYMELFDEMYWLNAGKRTVSMRLKKRARGRPDSYGATKAQRDAVLKRIESGSMWAKQVGFKFVDASLSPKKLFETITPQNIIIREYKPGDRLMVAQLLDNLQEHIKSVDHFRTEDMKKGFGKASLNELLKETSENFGKIYVAEDGKKIVGVAAAMVLKEDKLGNLGSRSGIKKGEVHSLFVSDQYRGKNIGVKLMAASESYLKMRGCTHIEVGVFWPNADARKFYEKSGYEHFNITYIKKV